MKKLITILLIAASVMVGCERRQEVVYVPQPAAMPMSAPAPMYYEDHRMSAGDAALVAGSVVAGAMVADYMINGRPRPGYMVMNGSVYRDTPQTRNVYKHTTVVKNTYIVQAPKTPTPTAPAAPATATPAKIKNPGDAAAQVEKTKMAQEAAQKQSQADLKARLQAKQAERTAAKSAPLNLSKPSGGGSSYRSFSQRAGGGSRRR